MYRSRSEDDLVVAPAPDDDRDGEVIEDQYDMYNNTQINVCRNVADGVYLPYVGDCAKYIECQSK